MANIRRADRLHTLDDRERKTLARNDQLRSDLGGGERPRLREIVGVVASRDSSSGGNGPVVEPNRQGKWRHAMTRLRVEVHRTRGGVTSAMDPAPLHSSDRHISIDRASREVGYEVPEMSEDRGTYSPLSMVPRPLPSPSSLSLSLSRTDSWCATWFCSRSINSSSGATSM